MADQKLTVVTELHKQARRNYPRRKVQMRGIDETWQADLVEMIPYSYSNKGFKYMLTVIDIFSKYAWAVAVKTSIVERFNRTLKNMMWPEFNLQGNYKWINLLPTLMSKYNNKKHRTIGMKPKDVTVEDTRELLRRIRKLRRIPLKRSKFKVGDRVRVSKFKNIFEKGYTPNWTTEIFTVEKVKSTKPVTYKLKDYQNQPIEGGFYEEELLKVPYPDVYLVEKVLKTNGNDVYVKWLGFDSSHNSWIKKSDT
ncbi:uncharacterized protein LOC122509234 [Leptopilina heterotoma]|uniref:uncharacterized protein LOC122509234 n=1 Tax=Leptopilina heterotoma TaxID=63436 RepID=UPI001CA9E16D|nr:uncharacterized protein LOC122509234 [Leptopilina heterotoma]